MRASSRSTATDTGERDAIVRAIPSASSRSSSRGTTLSTSPQSYAVAASMKSPVMFRYCARPIPTSRGRRCVPPPPGMSPSLISGWPSCASSDATRMSQHIASSSPPPRQKPWIAATNGVRAASMPVAELLDPACGAALLRLCGRLAQRRELRDVGARDERPLARADEHDRADAVVGVEAVDLCLELLEERRRERVHGRMVDRDDRDRAVELAGDVLPI